MHWAATTYPKAGYRGSSSGVSRTTPRKPARSPKRERRAKPGPAPGPPLPFGPWSLRGPGIRSDTATLPCEPAGGAGSPTPLCSAPCGAAESRPSRALGGVQRCGDWSGRRRARRASAIPASEAPPRSGEEKPSERAGLSQSSAPGSCPAAQPARDMASGSVAECLQQETTCPVCLQYFAEPMMLDCGHNICCACLARCWGAAETNVSCPQCRETFPQRHMRPNRHLANVTQLVKQLRTERPSGPGGEMGVCEKHREPLKLYCEQDQMPICVVCDRSREHRGHSVLPLEEAVEGFKVGPGRRTKGRAGGFPGPARRENGEPDVGPGAIISSLSAAEPPHSDSEGEPVAGGARSVPTPRLFPPAPLC